MERVKVIVLLGLPVLLLVAAMVLVLSNLGYTWDLHLYTRPVHLSRGLLMVLIALVGAVLWLACRLMLPAGLRALRARRKRLRQTAPEQRGAP